MKRFTLTILACMLARSLLAAEHSEPDPALANELVHEGWIAFSAQTESGDWDLFAMRPDGSDRRSITSTPEFNEAAPRFSPDGKRLLYYRMARSVPVDNNTYGTFDLVLADADGKNPTVFGRDFPWASWSPDSQELACLLPSGIRIIDVASRKTVRTLPRRGIVQQLTWSPDGKAFVGTANGLGPFWNIGRLTLDGEGAINAVSETERYNCTPDWCPDSRHIIYARGIIPNEKKRAELWIARDDGSEKKMLYAEATRHIYGACASPDSRYLLFTRSVEDLGAVGKSQTTMAVIRWADTPMIDDSPELRARFPDARPARRLDLGPGWEPHWARLELSGR